MAISGWLLVLAALVVAVTSVLAIWPDEPTEGGGQPDINLSGMEYKDNYVIYSPPEDVSFKIHFKAKRID